MKNRLLLFTAVAVAAACADATPTQPEGDLPSSPLQTPAATTVPAETFIAFWYPIRLPVQEVTGKVIHARGSIYVWTLSGDLTGTNTVASDWLFHRDGLRTGHGKFVMELTAPCEGTVEGNWHGILDPMFKGQFLGQGKGGCKGITVKGDFEAAGSNYLLRSTGTIHYSNAQG